MLSTLLLPTAATIFALSGILSGCSFIGNSMFPAELGYIEVARSLDGDLAGSPEDVQMRVLYDGSQEYLFLLDELAASEDRLLIFDSDLDLLYQGAGTEEVAGGEYGRLMMLAADLAFVVGNVTITSGPSFASTGPLNTGDDRFGFSDYASKNWVLSVGTAGGYYTLDTQEYDAAWASTGSGSSALMPYSVDLTPTIENAFYAEDEGAVLVIIHLSPRDDAYLLKFPATDFPATLSVSSSILEDGLYVEPLGLFSLQAENVREGSLDITADGIVYLDKEKRSLTRIAADNDNPAFPVTNTRDAFAFSLFGDDYYHFDTDRRELYRKGTWW